MNLIDVPEKLYDPDLVIKLPSSRMINRSGQSFGDWLVLGMVGYLGGYSTWLIVCKCGLKRICRICHLYRLGECCHSRCKYVENFFWSHFEQIQTGCTLTKFKQCVGPRPRGRFIRWNPAKKIGPENFFWADNPGGTHHKIYEVDGVKGTQADFARHLGITRQAMTHRMSRFAKGEISLKQSLTSPQKRR